MNRQWIEWINKYKILLVMIAIIIAFIAFFVVPLNCPTAILLVVIAMSIGVVTVYYWE